MSHTPPRTWIMSDLFRRRVASKLRRASLVAALVLPIGGSGCADRPTSPSGTAIATFDVGGEPFRVQLVGERQVEAARAAQSGGAARIPNGRIVPGGGINTRWSWHLEDVEFVEVAIELCDGRPSDVERQNTQFGGGLFCPWSARVA